MIVGCKVIEVECPCPLYGYVSMTIGVILVTTVTRPVQFMIVSTLKRLPRLRVVTHHVNVVRHQRRPKAKPHRLPCVQNITQFISVL